MKGVFLFLLQASTWSAFQAGKKVLVAAFIWLPREASLSKAFQKQREQADIDCTNTRIGKEGRMQHLI